MAHTLLLHVKSQESRLNFVKIELSQGLTRIQGEQQLASETSRRRGYIQIPVIFTVETVRPRLFHYFGLLGSGADIGNRSSIMKPSKVRTREIVLPRRPVEAVHA
jgi:hypothetical protein